MERSRWWSAVFYVAPSSLHAEESAVLWRAGIRVSSVSSFDCGC